MAVTTRPPSYPAGWLHDHRCVGCGPDNAAGLRLRPTLADDGTVTARFVAEDDLAGPPGLVHGGMLAVPMDCVASWAAMHALRARASAAGRDPGPVVALTGGYEVRLHHGTPTAVPLVVRGVPGPLEGRRLAVHVDVHAGDVLTATFDGVFVEVDLDAPDRDRTHT